MKFLLGFDNMLPRFGGRDLRSETPRLDIQHSRGNFPVSVKGRRGRITENGNLNFPLWEFGFFQP